jgi:HK97 family phage major capsid protein
LLQFKQAVADKEQALETAKTAGRAAIEAGGKLTDEQRAAVTEAETGLKAAKQELADYESVLATETSPKTRAVVQVTDRAAEDPMRGFASPREFMSAVMEAGRNPTRMDARLKPLKIGATQGSDEQGAYSDPYGGFFVPVGLSPTVLQLTPEDDPIAPLVTPVPLMAPTVEFNARVDKDHSTSVSGGFTVTRHPETVDGTSSRAKYEQVKLTADELFGIAFATERLLTDSPQSFAAIIAAGFKDQFSDHLIEERFNGTGAGEFLGFMKSGCLLTVAKEANQAADTVVTANIDKMVARCWRYGSAVWHANHTLFPALQGLTRAVGTGGSIVNYLSWSPSGQMSLLGRPLYLTEHCAALGDLGDIALCNWSEFLEGTYQPLQQAESIHVRFLAHERTFKLWLRNGGAPWWSSVLTPKRGDTRSAFVTLAAR